VVVFLLPSAVEVGGDEVVVVLLSLPTCTAACEPPEEARTMPAVAAPITKTAEPATSAILRFDQSLLAHDRIRPSGPFGEAAWADLRLMRRRYQASRGRGVDGSARFAARLDEVLAGRH
jgi:hypothetical protein